MLTTGFTTLISSLLGLITALAPDLVKEWVTGRNATRERDFLLLQADLQARTAQVNADARLAEVDGANQGELIRAMREHMTAILEAHVKPTGIFWIDAFNSLLRPAIVCLLMVVFAVVYVPLSWEVIANYHGGNISAAEAQAAINGGMVGLAIEAAFGFLFGARGYAAGKRMVG